MENSFTEIAFIYALLVPRNDMIRYIGKTIQPKGRLYSHCSPPKKDVTYRARWVRKLKRLNMKPIMKILKICELKEYEKWEEYYLTAKNII